MNLFTLCSLIFMFTKSIENDFERNEYCQLCENGVHTMCKYKEGPSDACVEPTSKPLSSGDKRTIVGLHNEIRNYVAMGDESRGNPGPQPQASNMKLLVWNGELAAIAQRWTDQCTFAIKPHQRNDKCRRTKEYEVGQNLYHTKLNRSQTLDFREVVLKWFEEVTSTNSALVINYNPLYNGKPDNSYTQLVWAKTSYIGCGYTYYKEKYYAIDHDEFIHVFVCNYGPSGNVLGQPVYNAGPPGLECLERDLVQHSLCKGLTLDEALRNKKIAPGATEEQNNKLEGVVFSKETYGGEKTTIPHFAIDAAGNIVFGKSVVLNLTGRWSGGFCGTKTKRDFLNDFRDRFKQVTQIVSISSTTEVDLEEQVQTDSYFNEYISGKNHTEPRKTIPEEQYNVIKIIDDSTGVIISIDRNTLLKYKKRCGEYYYGGECKSDLFVVKSFINLWKDGKTKEHMNDGDSCFCYHKVSRAKNSPGASPVLLVVALITYCDL